MKKVWKILIGLALVVPMGAYVVGALAASAADDPAPRQTIEIREPAPSPSATPSSTPPTSTSPRSTQPTSRTPTPTATETDDVEVITPDYDDLDHHDDRGDDDGGDHRGRGGDDHVDNSGHGGGAED